MKSKRLARECRPNGIHSIRDGNADMNSTQKPGREAEGAMQVHQHNMEIN